MNLVQLAGFVVSYKYDSSKGMPTVLGVMNVGNERGYDEHYFRIVGNKAKIFSETIQKNDEIIVLGRLAKTKKNKTFIQVKNIKIVKHQVV